MQINLDKKSGLLLGIIAGLLVVIVVLLVDKVGDDGHMIETHSHQIVSIG
jgi:cell division protein FtsN